MPELEKVLSEVDVLLINDAEARQLSGRVFIGQGRENYFIDGPGVP